MREQHLSVHHYQLIFLTIVLLNTAETFQNLIIPYMTPAEINDCHSYATTNSDPKQLEKKKKQKIENTLRFAQT